MSDRFPLILNTSTNQIQEIASGDTLDLTGNNIKGVGIITATTISGTLSGIATLARGLTDIPDINVRNITGVGATFSKDLDVDGHTNLDNVSISGVVTATTFSGNATSADTVDVSGAANANTNFYITFAETNGAAKTIKIDDGLRYNASNNVLTASYFSGNGANLSGITNASISNSAAIAFSKLATGALPTAITVASANIVDGTIVNADVNASAAIAGTKISPDFGSQNVTTTGNASVGETLTITGNDPNITFVDSNSTPDYKIFANAGTLNFFDSTSGQSRILINTDGHIDLIGNVDALNGLDVTGNATVSGNLSVGGVLTYEDVTNVDSVGIVTARNGIKVLAGGANVVGVVTATALNAGSLRLTDDGVSGPIASIMADDGNPWALQIGNSTYSTSYSTGHQFFVANGGNAMHEVRSSTTSYNDYIIRLNNSANTNKNCIKIVGSDQSVILYAGGSEMLQTTSTGATLLGELNATGANFTDDGQSSPIVSIMTDDTNPWGIQVGNSTYNSSTIFGWQVYVNNTGEGYQYHIGSGAYKDFHFYQHNQSVSKLMMKFEADDNSVELYGRGTKDLETTGTGVVVTGVCTATSFSGDGSNLTGVLVGITTEQVTPSSNVATLNLAKDDHKIVASGTYTIDVSGGTEASSHTLRIENSGTANVGFSTFFKFPSGGTPSLPTASGAISLISFQVHKVGSVGIATVLLAGASVNFS